MPTSPLDVAYVRAFAPAAPDGSFDVTVVAVDSSGVQRQLAAWSQHGIGPLDGLLLSRSPDGARAAVAFGTTLRTADLASGEVVAVSDIAGSETEVVFGWTPDGIAVVRRARSDVPLEVPLGSEWSIRVEGDVEQDYGIGSGFASSSGMVLASQDAPTPTDAEYGAAIAEHRADELAAAALEREFTLTLRHAGTAFVVHRERRSGIDGSTTLHWPPVVGPHGVLLRTSSNAITVGAAGSRSTGITSDVNPQHPTLVAPDGVVSTIPVELSQSPVAVLPDGRFLLPCGGPLWRDGADEPLTAMAADGELEHLVHGGELLRPWRIMRAVAPDWLPPEPHEQAMWAGSEWPGGEGFWVQEAVVVGDEALTILLAENTWRPDWQAPEACRWLVASVPLDGIGLMQLVGRGARAKGDHESVVL